MTTHPGTVDACFVSRQPHQRVCQSTIAVLNFPCVGSGRLAH